MSDPYQEAFEDVLQKERERQPVWVTGLSTTPGRFSYRYTAMVGIIVSETDDQVWVKVPSVEKPWVKKRSEVYHTAEEAHQALARKWQDEVDAIRLMEHAIRLSMP